MIKVNGVMETYIGGKKVREDKNTIDSSFYNLLAQVLADEKSHLTLAQTSLFNNVETQPDANEDGIVVEDNSLPSNASQYYSMTTVLSQPLANQIRATGTFVNPLGVSKTLTSPLWGANWITRIDPIDGVVEDEYFSDYLLAYNESWSVVVPASETLTLVWTVTFTVH